MRPRAFSKLMQAARVDPGSVALVVGCATGYSAAVLGKLAESVIALESDEDLAAVATATLGELEIDNVAVVSGPLVDGLKEQGPYDVIFVDGATAGRSENIENQLAGQIVRFVQELRKEDLEKNPGIAETLDWAAALVGLKLTSLDDDLATLGASLICLLKTETDQKSITPEITSQLAGKAA